MAVNPKTPGVYIDEVPVLPASIVGVATAIPAFIGYVEKADNNGIGIPLNNPTRITSLLEYEAVFGKGDGQAFTIDIDDDTTVTPTVRTITVNKGAESLYKMYYNVQMYFSNGGGPCYIVPIGLYSYGVLSKDDMLAGLANVAKVDEPTILVFPDVVSLTTPPHIREVYDAALAQCQKLKDRFTIMDVKHDTNNTVFDDIGDFRNDYVGADNLKYGASYYPFLNTTLGFSLNQDLLHVQSQTENGVAITNSVVFRNLLNDIELALSATRMGLDNAGIEVVNLTDNEVGTFFTNVGLAVTAAHGAVGAASPTFAAVLTPLLNAKNEATVSGGYFYDANTDYIGSPTQPDADVLIGAYKQLIMDLEIIRTQAYSIMTQQSGFALGSLSYLKNANPAVYSTIITQINSYSVQLNPSGAVAGIYARVDAERGVWKAPANVGVRSILGPSINITNSEQDDMNIDPTGGKSVNAIRTFVGRGILVWGARTLAGNDNEWRYVNVRRLFTYVEESTAEATEFVVFEPNTANTWQRVKGMIEAFLTGLWRDGALAGATTKDAFFVNVGLGTTMTAQDILEGRMIVQIGMAAVRPAEFIILQFEHKLQES